MGRMNLRMGASGVGSKVWVLTIGVLEVNPEWDSIRAQRGRARSALFSRVQVTSNPLDQSLQMIPWKKEGVHVLQHNGVAL